MSSITKFQLFDDVDSIKVFQGGSWVSQISDGTDTLAINSDGSINVVGNLSVNDTQNSAMKSSAVTVGDTSAVAIPATALSDRERIIVQNIGANSVYLGGSDVSATNGLVLPKGDSIELWAGPANILYAICDSGKSSFLRVLELA